MRRAEIDVFGTLAIVCDAAHEDQARMLGGALGARVFPLGGPQDADLADFDMVVLAELRDTVVVEGLRRKLGVRRGDRERYFICDQAPVGRAWQVQADALGATVHVPQV